MKVLIREMGTGIVVKEIEVDSIVDTSNYRKFLSGLCNKTNLDRYWIDTSEVDAASPASAQADGQ